MCISWDTLAAHAIKMYFCSIAPERHVRVFFLKVLLLSCRERVSEKKCEIIMYLQFCVLYSLRLEIAARNFTYLENLGHHPQSFRVERVGYMTNNDGCVE